MVKYQIWYKRDWPLSMPSQNRGSILRFARRLREAYNDKDKSIIRVRKIND